MLYAWRMKLVERTGWLVLRVDDGEAGELGADGGDLLLGGAQRLGEPRLLAALQSLSASCARWRSSEMERWRSCSDCESAAVGAGAGRARGCGGPPAGPRCGTRA